MTKGPELPVAHVQTPLIKSFFLSARAKCNVFLKLENTQPSGSFKLRGIGNLVATKIAEFGDVHIFCSSGGNAGLAAATAAFMYGKPCTVVVPKTTGAATIERLKKINAEVIVHGNHWAEADAYLRQDVMKSVAEGVHAVYCHPFDDPLVWSGHSTMIDEIAAQLPVAKPDAIVVAVGGGGLYNGVAEGMIRHGWAELVPIVAVETEGAASFYKSVEAKQNIVLPKIETVANCLGATFVTKQSLQYALYETKTRAITVTDDEAKAATYLYAEDHKAIVETACGAGLAAIYSNKLKDLVALNETSNVVVIVCGGTGIDVETVASYKP